MKSSFHQIIILTVLFIFHFNISFSQEIVWENTIGGNGIDDLTSIIPTNDGGYICGGWSNSNISGDKTENCHGSQEDYWVIKLDPFGNILWQKTIGGNDKDYCFSVVPTFDNGFICGGFSNSNASGDKTENSIGSYDYWVVKLDSVGNIQWQNTIGGTTFDVSGNGLYSITQVSDGGYVCGGYSSANISGDKIENSIGATDFWIIKLNPAGIIQWQNTIGGDSDDQLKSISPTDDGGIICGGSSWSNISGDKTENRQGGTLANDFWVTKLDSTGNIQWQNTIGGADFEYLNSIFSTVDGGYICGGSSTSGISGDKTENNIGSKDYWVVKLDSVGNIQWQKTIGGNGTDVLYSISTTVDGGFICGGSSNSGISGNKTENSIGGNDYWVVKLDSVGNILGQSSIGGKQNDVLESLSTTIDGGYICGGVSYSSFSWDKAENMMGWGDYWIVKLTDKYCTITGKLFLDLNSNSLQDLGEQSLVNKKVTEINTGKFDFTDEDGNYKLILFDTGSFVVYPDPTISYYNPSPLSQPSTFLNITQIDSLNDFAFQPSGTINDLCLTITPLGQFRSGFNAFYEINYANYGTTTINGDVIFLLDSNITYISSTVVPFSITGDSIVWSTGMLSPYQTGIIMVTVHIDSGIAIGTLIYPTVRIEPLAGDANPQCNTDSWEVYTTGSYDPNDILVRPEFITSTQIVAQPFLEYIIRFQNTGNDTAFSVKIINPIDTTKLEASTIELLSSSHPVNMKYIHSKNFAFDFENILLPDMNINKKKSHGFIHYRIKPKTNLIIGDSIINNALIYFDFNNPVFTNNAITKIIAPNSYNNISVSGCNSYLSPSGNYLWTTSGIYLDSLPNAAGYDSIITITLTLYKSFSTINPMVCDTFISPSSNYSWTNSGTYLDTIPNTSGCDSIITINLNITNVDTSVSVNNPTLISNATAASWQWIFCDSVPVPGSTNQSFVPTANGSYAVIVSQNGCMDTSLCYTVTGVGIEENNKPYEIVVKPSPANHSITIQCGRLSNEIGQLSIIDPFGREIYNSKRLDINLKEGRITIDISSFSVGLYFVQLEAGKQMLRTKFVKQ